MNGKSLRGAYLLVGGKGLSAVIGLGSMLILARLLEPEDYGLVVLVEAVVTLLAAITELQMASVLIHLPRVDDAHFSTAWTLNLIRAFILCLLVILIAPALAGFYEDPRLLGIAYVSSLSLFLGALLNPKMAILIRDLDFKKEFLLGLSQKIAGFVVTVVAAYYLRNYWALVLGTLATQVCGLLVSYFCYPFKPAFTLSKWRELWGFSVWLSLANFIKTLNSKLDQFVVGKMFSTGTTGVYSLATRLSTVLFTDTLGAALRVISPSLRAHTNNQLAMNKAYLNTQSLVTLVFLPVASITSALSLPLIDLALGSKWAEVTDVFRVLVLALCLEAIGGVGLSVVMATLNTRLAFFRDLLSIAGRAALMAIGLYQGGFTGLLLGRAASSVLDLLLYFAIAGKVTGLSIREQLVLNWRTALSCVLVYPVLYALQTPPWFELGESKLIQALWLLTMISLGFLMQVGVQAFLWLASGRPNSIEVVFLSYIRQKFSAKGKTSP
ncbi:lipopolysaccharide biosynthesis protein [Limnobacter parvus]|uniref:Lipopolysaccharide biosynthesis protein n=1 Tax=Limnobacter parvus TaxID=2939690 RepID=A0ABT1XI17_9BURK|nr:lipopolysaccharide biosynthesis protein [Limnobacter parvus]MCR2745922.1 lipopolysaccharide biosynthesis protein [Limnobacter parvus]